VHAGAWESIAAATATTVSIRNPFFGIPPDPRDLERGARRSMSFREIHAADDTLSTPLAAATHAGKRRFFYDCGSPQQALNRSTLTNLSG